MRYHLLTLAALMLAMTGMAQNNRVYIEDFEIEPGSLITVPVLLANESPTRGFQFNLSLPQGLTIVEYTASDYLLKFDMNMTCADNAKDNCFTAFVYPSSNRCLPPDTTAVMTIQFKADTDFSGGEIKFWKTRGSTLDNQTIYMDDSMTTASAAHGAPIDTQSDGNLFFNH